MNQLLAFQRPLDELRQRAARLPARARQLSRAYPRETVGVGLLGLVGAAAIGVTAWSAFDARSASAATMPAPPPLLVRAIPPQQALEVNTAIPLASGPNPAAAPFAFKGDKAARARALECLASTVYYEAGQESADGQRAVAQIVLNRVRHPAFPASVCGVVFEGSTRATGCQFTFTCDGSLYRQPDAAGWRRAYAVAEAALAGAVHKPVGWATHYHANYVVPYWAPTLAKNAVVGAHIFYRWGGGWGRPDAFKSRYAGREPSADALRTAALAAEAATANQVETTVAAAVEEIPGAEPIKLEPSMRGDKRVAVRFNMAAREATEALEPKAYVEKFTASDNLRWTLSSDTAGASQAPLGAPKAEAEPGPTAVVAAQR